MVEQHPIPQQISSYEFKLVGDMTLKQFLKAAAGIVIAMLINASPLIFFLKYPLMLLFGAGGLLVAFVPFQDRPLETWLIAFLRSIYSPTIYTYHKSADENWLGLTSRPKVAEVVEEKDKPPVKDEQKVKEFIESLPSVKRINTEVKEEKPETREAVQETTNIGKIGMAPESKLPAREETPTETDWRDKKADLGLKSEKLAATGQAIFGEIPMPDKPDVPNMVVGMVTDTDGKIVEGAIVEIQDSNGNPARVLKTNPLGQFKTSTPLGNGKFLVITEKEKYNFNRVEIVLNNTIIDPIKIQAII